MKVTIVSGARPNFMKIAPICRAINAARSNGKDITYRLINTGHNVTPALMHPYFPTSTFANPTVI